MLQQLTKIDVPCKVAWYELLCYLVYLSSAGVEYTSFEYEYEYATFKIIEYEHEYLVLESSTSTQSPSTRTRVLLAFLRIINIRLIFMSVKNNFLDAMNARSMSDFASKLLCKTKIKILLHQLI